MQPSDSQEIQDLDLVVGRNFVSRQLPYCLPMALEHSLVEQAERCLFLSDLAAFQDLDHALVEITRPDFDVPINLLASLISLGLGFLQPPQRSEAFYAFLTKKEVPKPLRLALQNLLCRPRVGLPLVLRTSKAVYVGAVFCDLNEYPEVLLNELGFVFGPDRVANPSVPARLRLAARR